MTFSLAIAIIVIADVALIAALAYVMSHARRLEPHVSALSAQAPETVAAARRAPARPQQRPSRKLVGARS
jgi:predicted membrane protein